MNVCITCKFQNITGFVFIFEFYFKIVINISETFNAAVLTCRNHSSGFNNFRLPSSKFFKVI